MTDKKFHLCLHILSLFFIFFSVEDEKKFFFTTKCEWVQLKKGHSSTWNAKNLTQPSPFDRKMALLFTPKENFLCGDECGGETFFFFIVRKKSGEKKNKYGCRGAEEMKRKWKCFFFFSSLLVELGRKEKWSKRKFEEKKSLCVCFFVRTYTDTARRKKVRRKEIKNARNDKKIAGN